ncbi:Ribosome-interacting GTPase 1 [Paramyrothecium foliicola]|nr:Ribosome-interacting GTPase 1 [Paramyrothecium foliicola]
MSTTVDKIKEIEAEMAKTQKNKATSYHLGQLKAKLAKLKRELLTPTGGGGGGGAGFDVARTGVASIGFIGFPSVGKSTLMSRLTGQHSEAAAYEFTTLTSVPGQVVYNDEGRPADTIAIVTGAPLQIIDLPGIIEGAKDGRGRGRQVIAVAKTCHLIFIVLDVNKPLTDKRVIEGELEGFGIRINKEPPNITFKKKDKGGLNITSTVPLTHIDHDEIKAVMSEYRINSADITIRCDATVDDLIDVLEAKSRSYIPVVYCLNKIDSISIEELDLLYRIPNAVPISSEHGWNVDELMEAMWEKLSLKRVYTKPKGKQPDYSAPVVLRASKCTVEDFCNAIHRTIVEQFKTAIVYGKSVKHQPQRVGLGHELDDEDVDFFSCVDRAGTNKKMNNTVNGSTAMGEDSTMAPTHGYGNDSWASISPYSQSPYSHSPMNEYNAFAYLPHGLPSESISRMPPPPQPQHHQMIQPAPSPHPQPPVASPAPSSAAMAHQQLPMLTTTWPSQLTNPTPPSGSYSAPPLSVPPPSAAPPVEAPRLPAQHEKARKTLSNEQKRAMCLYHEENPGTRQADIGARFGVERSTVSKVLRHKDQYLKRDQEPEQAALKRGKGKHPDFDRTLSNYVRRQQQRGFDVKDEEILEQAKLFAHASGNQETILTSLTSNWLQKFKQKHGIGGGRLMRRASETNIPDSARLSTSVQGLGKDSDSSNFFPTSPTGQLSPLSGSKSDEELQADGLDFDFTYRSAASHSTTSLTGDLRENNPANLSAAPMSPTASFNFSPDPNVGAFAVGGSDFHHHHREKRSNTFPSLNIEYVNQVTSTEPVTPRHPTSGTAPSSALDSPASELQPTPFAIDTTLASPPTLRRSNSNSSLTARGISSTPVDLSPVSPSQEDARRAANTLLNYISNMSTNGQFDQTEYLTIVQLTKKLQLHQHQSNRPSMGGLSRIPEGDGEVPPIASGTIDPR